MGTFERYLTVWVALCIVVGVTLGSVVPGPFRLLGSMTVAQVNMPVAVLIWLMVIPMLLRVDFGTLGQVARHWRGMVVTLGVNWLVKPFSMAALGWLFIGWLFRPWLPPGQIDSYIAGLILLAAAPCTAMVFVWSNLTDGEPNFTLSQVALNDAIMVVAFAPVVGLLLGLSAITVPWDTLADLGRPLHRCPCHRRPTLAPRPDVPRWGGGPPAHTQCDRTGLAGGTAGNPSCFCSASRDGRLPRSRWSSCCSRCRSSSRST